MHDRNARVPSEVPIVEGQQLQNTVHQHRSDEPGVMHLDARYRVSNHEPAPFCVNPLAIRQ
jgi:hypothetical protein